MCFVIFVDLRTKVTLSQAVNKQLSTTATVCWRDKRTQLLAVTSHILIKKSEESSEPWILSIAK